MPPVSVDPCPCGVRPAEYSDSCLEGGSEVSSSRNVILRLGACLERERERYSIVRPVAVTGIGKLTLNLVRRFNRTPNA